MLGERSTVVNAVERWKPGQWVPCATPLQRDARQAWGQKAQSKAKEKEQTQRFASQKGCAGVWGKTWTAWAGVECSGKSKQGGTNC